MFYATLTYVLCSYCACGIFTDQSDEKPSVNIEMVRICKADDDLIVTSPEDDQMSNTSEVASNGTAFPVFIIVSKVAIILIA